MLIFFFILVQTTLAQLREPFCPPGWKEEHTFCWRTSSQGVELKEAIENCLTKDPESYGPGLGLFRVGQLRKLGHSKHHQHLPQKFRVDAVKDFEGNWREHTSWQLIKFENFPTFDQSEGKKGDTLIFDVHDKELKVVDKDHKEVHALCYREKWGVPFFRQCGGAGLTSVCNDRGDCIQGACVCDSGFSGDACEIRSSSVACPTKPPTIPVFNATRYLGNWYQVQGVESFFQPPGIKCVRATYGAGAAGTITVRNVAVSYDGIFSDICGTATIPNLAKPGDILVNFPFFLPGSYWLLDTDYDNYAVVYSCAAVPGHTKLEYAWLLTRKTNPSRKVIKKGLRVFIKNGISLENFKVIDQGEECFYENPNGTSCAQP